MLNPRNPCVLQDQARALDIIHNDPELKDLRTIEAPLFDLEIRGVPALQFMGDVVWQ
jgi:arsenite-transporting ATPase